MGSTANKGKELNADAEKLRTYLTENPPDAEDLKSFYEKILGILDSSDSSEAKVTALKAVLPSAENQPADTSPNPNAVETPQ